MKPLNYAKAYLDYGWSLIPIAPDTKKPTIKWTEFQRRQPTLDEVTGWINKGWYLAVVTGDISGILIVDDDRVKNGLKEWGFESPVTATTSNGGKHYYFKYDREIHSHSNTKLFIDLKAWHSYCLVPPFNNREWLSKPSDNLSKLTPLSDEIVRLINSDMEKRNDREPLRMADFLDIEEGVRTNSLYRIACSIFTKVKKDDGLRILAGVNQTYNPPLEDKEFKYQSSRAYNFATSDKSQSTDKPTAPKDYLTDTTNAEKIAELFGDKLRFDHRRHRWLIWGQHSWEPDRDGKINRSAIKAARKQYQEAGQIEDSDKKSRVSKWAIQSESKSRLDSAVSIVKNLQPITDTGDNWDTDLMLLSCPNGIIDLKTGQLRDGKPEDRITMTTSVEYDPDAKCSRWMQFIDEIFENNKDLIHYVRKSLGYSISGLTTEQAVFFCFGVGSNGKSVLFSLIREILKDYAHSAPAALFQRNISATASNDVAAIEFKRFLISSENLSATKINEQRMKKWSGGDEETARYLYSEFFSFQPSCKIWLFINHKPEVEDDSLGFWRRVRLIPFNRIFKGVNADPKLLDKLRAEMPGILSWLVKGCLLWQAEGLEPTPEIVLAATKDYRKENDLLAEFLSEKCIEIEDEDTSIKASDFYKAYVDWAEEEKLKGKDVITRTAFGRRVSDKYQKEHKEDGTYYQKIRLKTSNDKVEEKKETDELGKSSQAQTGELNNNLVKPPIDSHAKEVYGNNTSTRHLGTKEQKTRHTATSLDDEGEKLPKGHEI